MRSFFIFDEVMSSTPSNQNICINKGQCMASKMYVDQLKDVLVHSTSKKVAGFIAEPIQVRILFPTSESFT